MKILGRQVKVFGGGMGKVDFVLPYVRDRDVLDIGVVKHSVEAYDQPNWIHRNVAAAARRCVGIDILDDECEVLRRRGYDVRAVDAQDFDLGERFDVVLAGDIIEHLHDQRGFFESVDRHLRPGGKLIITTPNPWFWLRILQAVRGEVWENPEHTGWFSRGTLAELLGRYGYAIERAVYGSSEGFLGKLPVPRLMRHTSLWVVAHKR